MNKKGQQRVSGNMSSFNYNSKIKGSTITYAITGLENTPNFNLLTRKLFTRTTRKVVSGMYMAARNVTSPVFSTLRITELYKRWLGKISTLEENLNNIQVLKDEEGNDRYFSKEEMVVQFNEDESEESAHATIKRLDCSIKHEYEQVKGFYVIEKPGDKKLVDAIDEFNEIDGVRFCEPSEYGMGDQLSQGPTRFQLINEEKFWALRKIEAPAAWQTELGQAHVIISIIDSGIDLGHQNLRPNILDRGTEKWDFFSDDDIPDDEDVISSHGTFVAGIAAAADCVTDGTIGVCPNAKIMPLRVDMSKPRNSPFSVNLKPYHDRYAALFYIYDNAVKNTDKRYIISCSWQTRGDSPFVYDAIKRAIKKGALVLFAAGNKNENLDKKPRYPASYPEVITVAATDRNDEKWAGSNYGTCVDVCAPGHEVWSTKINNGYEKDSGTSFAVPHVAGLAALIWSKNPNLKNDQVENIIKETCDDIRDPKYKKLLGAGRINARKALQRV